LQSVRGNTPILCENRRPEVGKKLKWPYLECCDSGDLCNSVDIATPPAWVSSTRSDVSAVIPSPSRLGGVVVSVLATGPKGCGFETGQDDGFLRAIKILSTPSSLMGSQAVRSHVVRFYGMLKNS